MKLKRIISKFRKTNFSKRQKDLIADKLMDSANYALAGLVFASFISEESSTTIVIAGIIVYIFGWILSIKMKA